MNDDLLNVDWNTDSLVIKKDSTDSNILYVQNPDVLWSSIPTTTNTLVGKCDYSDITITKSQGTTSTGFTSNSVYYCPNTNLFSSSSYSIQEDSWKLPTKDEVLEVISTTFNRYGFNYNIGDNTYKSGDEQIISKKLKNDKIFGWICCGELEKSTKFGNLLYPWNHIIPDLYMDQSIVTLNVSKDAYFDDFSIRVLLDSHIVFVDSRGKKIINIIQDTILENLNKAFEEIQNELTKNSPGFYGSYTYTPGFYDADFTLKTDNYGNII